MADSLSTIRNPASAAISVSYYRALTLLYSGLHFEILQKKRIRDDRRHADGMHADAKHSATATVLNSQNRRAMLADFQPQRAPVRQ